MNLSINSKDLKVIANKSCIYLLESIPNKKKMNIYMLDIMSKVLKHLYLATFENLLLVSIFENKLIRIYISPESSKLTVQPSIASFQNYQTNKNDIDFIVKINNIRKDNSFSSCVSTNFIIESEVDPIVNNGDFFKKARKPSINSSKPINKIFVKGLLSYSFSYSNGPIFLNFSSFFPDKIFISKSIFEPRWKTLKFFRDENCYRILGLEPDKLQWKKWGFPYLSADVIDGLLVPRQGIAN